MAELDEQPNPLLLAADNSPELLPLLRSNPSLASAQDEHGYSLMHAASSYNRLELLGALVNEFDVDVDLKDEDGETALFVTETVDCAKFLVEDLHADMFVVGNGGQTAREKISEENDFPEVAVYLRMKELEAGVVNGVGEGSTTNGTRPPPLPEGVRVNLEMMNPEEAGEVVDPEFRRRIQELAERDDYEEEGGQDALRQLVGDAIRGDIGQQREVRRRTG
ncbi:hypothetical protein G7Y89_g7001 [Cudoniella acicularis]|uniref:Ankyrin repeat-containing protein n=1 Tax=Cudoniella acicularis TaxID=354080 RepID=A0A8H4RLP6_9HELO|nr:hypothetical protein G7Y89_g7001 [Cudoniella acicularis]